MFLEKISRLAGDWGKQVAEMEEIAKASLRYGMRLDKHPGKLKRELKKLKIDSTLATPLWSGNAYMLITMPQVIVDKRRKIPSLEDFNFAKRVLDKKDLKELKSKIRNLPKFSSHEILDRMIPAIKRQAYSRGRFLPQFDRMYGGIEDIQQDLFVEAASIVNKQITNLKTHNIDDIMKYMGFCFKKKSDTYLRANAPKSKRIQIEKDKMFEDLIHEHKVNEGADLDSIVGIGAKEFAYDLRKILNDEAFRAVGILMGFSSEEDSNGFEVFLSQAGVKRSEINNTQLKKQIEKYIGKSDIFNSMQRSKALMGYLKGECD